MATYNSENTNPTPATGVVGTVLGGAALAIGSGLLGGNGLFGNVSSSSSQQSMALQLAEKDSQIALLQAGKEVDAKLVEVYSTLRTNEKALEKSIADTTSRVLALETAAPLREQIVLGQVNSVAQSVASTNAVIQQQIACIQNTLSGITKTVVPNAAVNPGWGNVTITPASSTTTAST